MPKATATDGVSLHYEVHGSGAIEMILLHGMGGCGTSWQSVLGGLDPAIFRTVILDLRGHGKSKGDASGFNFPQLTADILAIADAAGIRRAIIVGLSGSGKNAVCVALAAPERIKGLILVVPPGLGQVPLPRETLSWFFDYVGREGRIPPEFDPWFTAKIGAHRATVARDYAQTSRAMLDASAELWVHTSVAAQASELKLPVLVIAGAKEPIYHPEFQRQTTLATLPHACLEVLECGHFMTFEEPLALAQSLARFGSALG